MARIIAHRTLTNLVKSVSLPENAAALQQLQQTPSPIHEQAEKLERLVGLGNKALAQFRNKADEVTLTLATPERFVVLQSLITTNAVSTHEIRADMLPYIECSRMMTCATSAMVA